MCRERVDEFRQLGCVQAAGERNMMLVSTASPGSLLAYCDEIGFKGPVVSDKDSAVYDFLGARRSVAATLLWKRPWINFLGGLLCAREAFCRCLCPVPVVGNAGNPWQQGGCLILKKEGKDAAKHRGIYLLNEEHPGWPRHDMKLLASLMRP